MDMNLEGQVKKALKLAMKKAQEHHKTQYEFDKLAGKYFGVNDFSLIYANHDELVDPLIYGDSNLTWNQLCKTVKEYKKELVENQQE